MTTYETTVYGKKHARMYDATLFDPKKADINRKAPVIVTQEELRSLRGDVHIGKQQEHAMIMTKDELARIKASTKIETAGDRATSKKILNDQWATKQSAANNRKAKMIALDKERQHKLPPTAIEAEGKDKELGILSKAQMQLDEEHDDVKQMNQMVMYSKIVTVRDKQKEESKLLEEEWVREQKRLDLMMEIERLKSLQEQEERDNRRADARKRGAQVIIEQIKEREQERIKQRELLEKEKAQMLRNIEVMKEADAAAAEKKKQRNIQMVSEVEAFNRVALGKKEEVKMKEKNDDLAIASHERQKAEMEMQRLDAERKVKEEKEKEVQRLRDLQERAADRQSEIDALRQKRAFEESERNERAKEKATRERQMKLAKELDVARKLQFVEKEEMLSQQAKMERDTFLGVITKQKAAEEHERMVEDEKKGHLRNHAVTIRNQIEKNGDVRKQDRLDYLEEGRRVRQKLEDDRLKVEGIKAVKISGLQTIGIAEKYQAELAKKKIL